MPAKKIKQNDALNNIVKNVNELRNSSIDPYGEKKVETKNGTLKLKVEADQKERFDNKFKYPNVQKLILYFCMKMTQEHSRNFHLDINELLTLKGQTRNTRNLKTLKEDLELLEKIQISNFTAIIDGKRMVLQDGFLFKVEHWEELKTPGISLLSITSGSWANPMIKSEQFFFIPESLFSFKKLKFNLSYNILSRCRNEHKKMYNNNQDTFALTVKSLLKNININLKKFGSTKVIQKLEEVLNDLQKRNWFNWQYRNQKISQLPARNKFREYKKFMIDFNLSNTRLGQLYNISAQ